MSLEIISRYPEDQNNGRVEAYRCHCGARVETNGPGRDFDCFKCHRSFNSAGQELADRSQWGEETGETAADFDRGNANPERAFDEDI